MRRALVVVAMMFVLVFATAGTALAHICFPVNKPPGPGVAAVATIDLETEEFTLVEGNFTKHGRFKGGFLTIHAVLDGQTVASFDTFAHNTLPSRFQPTGDGCDGIGIDDAEACVMQILEDAAD